MSKIVNWIFGRGISISCGLNWVVPEEWDQLPRKEVIKNIKTTLRAEMAANYVGRSPLDTFLEKISTRTANDWCHQLVTTNWDYLIQQAVNDLELEVVPSWLADGCVWHLNGSVEVLQDNSARSPFLLEGDPYQQRVFSCESNVIFNRMIWNDIFFVVGMSFECESDRYLLYCMNKEEDKLPIGESHWFVINPDKDSLEESSSRIQSALPGAHVYKLQKTFDEWINSGMETLFSLGVFY